MLNAFNKTAENWLGDFDISQVRSPRHNARSHFEDLIDEATENNDVEGTIQRLIEESHFATPEEQEEIAMMLKILGYQRPDNLNDRLLRNASVDEGLLAWLKLFDRKKAADYDDDFDDEDLPLEYNFVISPSGYLESFSEAELHYDWMERIAQEEGTSISDFVRGVIAEGDLFVTPSGYGNKRMDEFVPTQAQIEALKEEITSNNFGYIIKIQKN